MRHILGKLIPVILLSLTLSAIAQENYQVVIDYQFDNTDWLPINGLCAVQKGDKWGYIDESGKLVIDYQFDTAEEFASNGLAAVQKGDKWGYINQSGEVIIDFLFDWAGDFTSNGLAAAKRGGKCGFIDQKGKTVIDFKYDDVSIFGSNGLADVKKGGKWGFIDKTGKVVIDFQFENVWNFIPEGFIPAKKGNKWGFINQSGKVVIDYIFDGAKYFDRNGLAAAAKGDKWGYIDQSGNVIIDFQFNDAYHFDSFGMAAVEKGDKWGYINQSGKLVTDSLFDFLSLNGFASNGLAAVRKGDKNGYIDLSGNTVIDFQFDGARDFSSNGLACVGKNGKYGYIKLLTPSNDITEYINREILKWQEKGKYEPTEDYKVRISEINRKKKLEELSDIAVQNIAPKYCNLKVIKTEYDADNQTSKINVKGLSPFYLKVPLSEAEAFDSAIDVIQFQNQEYALGNDGKFFLQKALIKNPNNGKTYNYSSTDKAVFAYTQLKMNFEPLKLNIQTTDNTTSVKTETKTISVGSSDVDINIPTNPQTNDKTFAVIIANENYTREVKVQFAANDGKVFKDYCEKTLGIPAKNIHFSQDATFGTMKSEIKWLSDIIAAFNGQTKIIFYYAGHGMPNEADKSAYLLPVDGFSSDFETAIKLDDLYSRLNSYPSRNVTVFLDACFSGSVRDNGMLASARGVKIKPKTDVLNNNMVVFSAATGDETAYPYKEKQHGLFTYFLLKKLQDTKGDVDYQTLSNYIIENVKQQSIVVNQKSQTPQVNTSDDIRNIWPMIKMN